MLEGENDPLHLYFLYLEFQTTAWIVEVFSPVTVVVAFLSGLLISHQ